MEKFQQNKDSFPPKLGNKMLTTHVIFLIEYRSTFNSQLRPRPYCTKLWIQSMNQYRLAENLHFNDFKNVSPHFPHL